MAEPWYALAHYVTDDRSHAALVLDGALHDLPSLAARKGVSDALAARIDSVDALVRGWALIGRELGDLARWAHGETFEALSARPRAPFTPHRLFGAASNYIEHADEMATKLAAKAKSMPYIFLKTPDSVIGPDEPVLIPPESQRVDWEVELGVVIGRPGRRIAVESARDHIAGYVVINDISARDLTRRNDFPFSHDWFRGKSFDSFTPMGPWFVPADCIDDPHALRLTLSVNGEMMQDGSSSEMIFDTDEQIAYLSTLLMLKPGDVIATGTPAGVGMGRGIFLKPGDEIVAAIDAIGTLANPVRAEMVAE